MSEWQVPETVREQLDGAEPAEIVFGLVTFNDHATAPGLALRLAEGITRSFPHRRMIVVNCDAGSQDGTPQAIKETLGTERRCWTIRHPVHGASLKLVSESGVPGREEAVRILAFLADKLDATACLVVDGNQQTTEPTWPQVFVEPILDKGADCVLPWFRRNRYEGTLTNLLLAPLTSALYGKFVPCHLGGAYAFSSRFIRSILLPQPWDEGIGLYGIDGWMTTLAVAEQVEVCRAGLGLRVQQAKPMGDLSTVVAQMVGCVFHLMERHQERWESVRGLAAIQTVGDPAELGAEAGSINVERMVGGFRQGLRDLLPVWQLVLPVETFRQVLELAVEETDSFSFPPDLWVQVVYDFALAYHNRLLHREHLLKALTPLYLGYTASFVVRTRQLEVRHVEQEIERLACLFERMKPYLVQRWRWHDE